MGSLNYDAFKLIFLMILLTSINGTALPNQNPKSNSTQINSNSVLVALLDSHYTELSELVEKALLLQTLEQTVSHHNITIFAPNNEALERQMDPEFKRFLLEPGNLKSLQNLLLFHIIPSRVGSKEWPSEDVGAAARHQTLCVDEADNHLPLTRGTSGEKIVGGLAKVTRPDDVIRPDGLIHGIERLLVPRSVQEDFNRRRSLRSISAVLPEGAPVVDPRTHRLKKPAAPVPAGAPPVVAEEADGSVKFGQGEGSAYLFDPDIYTDGRISVQGIDGVLLPVETPATKISPATAPKIVAKQRRGKLLEVACSFAGAFGRFTSCN
ncbi:hypothetical protein E3N88_02895 [Mikania micrantha]|uniref:FAS1 domain-containing protein n=1 Tax=Mikania micrantha TaxID=192012 RepID=A0A5N6Q577_9ASTR|nr:hypothetical protein E3N88_02895 [Mikania micrantha]